MLPNIVAIVRPTSSFGSSTLLQGGQPCYLKNTNYYSALSSPLAAPSAPHLEEEVESPLELVRVYNSNLD